MSEEMESEGSFDQGEESYDEQGSVESGASETEESSTGEESEAPAGEAEQAEGESQSDNPEKSETLEDLLAEDALDKKVRLKINGEEKVLTVRELQKVKQLEAASYEKMRSAAEQNKRAQRIAELAEKDPVEFLKLTGQDPYQLAEKLMMEQLALSELSPEQREIRKYKQEAETHRQKLERIESEQSAYRQQQATRVEQEKLSKEVEEAWSETGLPRTQEFDQAVYQVMLQDYQAKNQEAQALGLGQPAPSLTAKEAASIVKNNWLKNVSAAFGNMDAQAILEHLGADNVSKLRKADIKRVSSKSSPKFSTKKGPGSSVSRKQKQNRPLTEAEYRQWQEDLLAQS